MAQAFRTTYMMSYPWHDYSVRTKSLKPAELVYAEPPKANIWLDATEAGVTAFCASSIEDLQKFVNKLYRNRKWTTYHVSYCKNIIKETMKDDEQLTEIPENALIEYGDLLYAEPTKKILQPLGTSRKLLGYMRPKNLYTGLSEYQDKYGRLGYNILKTNYERSKLNKALVSYQPNDSCKGCCH